MSSAVITSDLDSSVQENPDYSRHEVDILHIAGENIRYAIEAGQGKRCNLQKDKSGELTICINTSQSIHPLARISVKGEVSHLPGGPMSLLRKGMEASQFVLLAETLTIEPTIYDNEVKPLAPMPA